MWKFCALPHVSFDVAHPLPHIFSHVFKRSVCLHQTASDRPRLALALTLTSALTTGPISVSVRVIRGVSLRCFVSPSHQISSQQTHDGWLLFSAACLGGADLRPSRYRPLQLHQILLPDLFLVCQCVVIIICIN